jgi:YVTN family beta-propeller protein
MRLQTGSRLPRGLAVCALLAGLAGVRPAPAQVSSATAAFGQVVSLGGGPSDIVLDELRGRLYLVNSNANRIDILSTSTRQVTGSIRVGTYPLSAALSTDGSLLYVTNTQSSSLSIVDLSTDSLLQNVSLPAKPEGVAVGNDGRVLITTQGSGTNNALNTLLIFDGRQATAQQVLPVLSTPPISTPSPLPAVFVGRPATPFPGKLLATPDGRFIIGMVAINQTTTSAQTTVFVYEVASGVVLQNRTVTGQSTVLALSPDASHLMAGSTLYSTGNLTVEAQLSTYNLPFYNNGTAYQAFNVAANYGGSAFSPDGNTLYSAFNQATTGSRTLAQILYVGSARNLGVRLGVKLPESIVGHMVINSEGSDIWAISESGILYLPISTLYDYPIIQVDKTQIFLAQDDCNKGIPKTAVSVTNLGTGRLTFAVPTVTTALVGQQSSGLVPATISFSMEPGRSGVVRQPGTNLFTGATSGSGAPIALVLTSPEAINIPNVIRVFMNFRQSDQRGLIFPVPGNPVPTATNNGEGLEDIVLDEARGRLYLANSSFNRVEVFDTQKLKWLAPVEVGQLPHSMAMSLDSSILYVGNTGGESISVVDLELGRLTGSIDFPPIPRNGTQAAISPSTMAMGLSGLQFIMSNGTFWRVIGNTAVPRASSAVLPTNQTITTPRAMQATPDGQYIITLAGNGNAYLYDALNDVYTTGRLLYNNPAIQSYFGPLAGAPGASYFLASGMILSSSLSVIGGAERPGTTTTTGGTTPGLPPTQTVVSAGNRNVAAVFPIDESRFIRLTTPVRQTLTTTTRDDARATLELVNIATGAVSSIGVAPENPIQSVFGTTRVNVPPRQLLMDSKGTVYAVTLSGLSVIPLNLNGTDPRPQIAAGNRAIVNSSDGTASFKPGSFITINGANLASASTADSVPLPTVLGGSCVVFNDIALPLLETAPGRISAQIPTDVRSGQNVVQVRSLATATSSDPIIVTVQKP